MSRTLSAPVTVAFDYTRSTGPVLGRFLSGLRDGVVVGGRTSEGKVVVPPPEFDPVTHAAVDDFVEVADTGTVTSWSWVPEPVKGQPFDRPFAFALVTLDGADAPLLHALDVDTPDDVVTGMRVRIRWRVERAGAITDIECFERLPAGGAGSTAGAGGAPGPGAGGVGARGAGRGDHRHRVLRTAARWRVRIDRGGEGDARSGHRDRGADRAGLPVRRLAGGVAVLYLPLRGPAGRPAVPHVRQGLHPAAQ